METTVADTIRKSIRKTADFILLQKLLLFVCTHTNNETMTNLLSTNVAYIVNILVSGY